MTILLKYCGGFLSQKRNSCQINFHKQQVSIATTCCYEANETRGVRIHLQGFIKGTWSQTSMGRTLANKYINGRTKSTPRTSVGLRSANSIQQGKAERDNPGTQQ